MTSTARQPVGTTSQRVLRQRLTIATAADRVRTRMIDRVALSHDASQYILRPQAVVTATSTAEIGKLFAVSRRTGVPMTFRSGGTSLSGQSISDGVLVDSRREFRDVEVLGGGARVRCGPGATVRVVNAHLRSSARKLGPDPASEGACTIGGVVANNSSGMACGVEFNSYHTLDSLTVVLPSGTVIDTGAPDASARLKNLEPALHEGLLRLRDRVRANTDSKNRIRRLYSIKNTMGYSVNAFVDHDDPVDILAHLMVGSEGTLGFIAEVVLRTIPVLPSASTALLLFDELESATGALEPLLAAGAKTLELLDAASLRVAQGLPHPDPVLYSTSIDNHAALLVEVQEADGSARDDVRAELEKALLQVSLSRPADFTEDPARRAAIWKVRKGLYPAVSAGRPAGTATLLEDVAIPVAQLSSATRDLTRLLGDRGYPDAVIFGHAKDGNLHFLVNADLDDADDMRRYEAFTEDLVDLILDRGGVLKAEHGTGRIMAAFVERQFGPELYAVMREIKRLFDPAGLLNPGVIISDNPRAHLENLKSLPLVDTRIDSCVDCGFCEPVCPSRDLTTTPRQRIALMREISVASPRDRRAMQRDFAYAAVDTCAADSLCVTACPVAIDTGVVMKSLRAARRPGVVQAAGAVAARKWGPIVRVARLALRAVVNVPRPLLGGIAAIPRAIGGKDWIPRPGPELPGPGARRVETPERRA